MGAADIRLRMATQDDAQTVASIITTVSEGVIEYLLGDLFPGMTPEKILEMILIRGSGNLNLSNVLLVDVGGELAGLLFAYDAKEQTVSGMMEGFLGEARVKPMRPLLEAKVEKALWINTLWVNESFRGNDVVYLYKTNTKNGSLITTITPDRVKLALDSIESTLSHMSLSMEKRIEIVMKHSVPFLVNKCKVSSYRDGPVIFELIKDFFIKYRDYVNPFQFYPLFNKTLDAYLLTSSLDYYIFARKAEADVQKKIKTELQRSLFESDPAFVKGPYFTSHAKNYLMLLIKDGSWNQLFNDCDRLDLNHGALVKNVTSLMRIQAYNFAKAWKMSLTLCIESESSFANLPSSQFWYEYAICLLNTGHLEQAYKIIKVHPIQFNDAYWNLRMKLAAFYHDDGDYQESVLNILAPKREKVDLMLIFNRNSNHQTAKSFLSYEIE